MKVLNILLLAIITGICARAQNSPLAFEAVSIKPSYSRPGNSGVGHFPDGRFIATNATLLQLGMSAYDLPNN